MKKRIIDVDQVSRLCVERHRSTIEKYIGKPVIANHWVVILSTIMRYIFRVIFFLWIIKQKDIVVKHKGSMVIRFGANTRKSYYPDDV